MKYSWLLFDADETLFDFAKAESNALKWTLEQSGVPFQPEYVNLYAKFNQQVWRELERGEITAVELRVKRFQLFFDQLSLPDKYEKRIWQPSAISKLYLQNLARGTDLLKDAEDVVRSCKSKYRLALVTNGLKEVQLPRLQNSTLHDCFEQVCISEEMGAAKPSPDYFDAVFSHIQNPARDKVLIIGDSLSSDIKGGFDYGIDTCWYNPTGISTDIAVTYEISQLKDLLPIRELRS